MIEAVVASRLVDTLQWAGSILGLVGAFLLATHTRASRYGWVAFLLANIAMIAFAFGLNLHGLLVQQVGFTVTSLLGLYRAGMLPFYSPKSTAPISALKVGA